MFPMEIGKHRTFHKKGIEAASSKWLAPGEIGLGGFFTQRLLTLSAVSQSAHTRRILRNQMQPAQTGA